MCPDEKKSLVLQKFCKTGLFILENLKNKYVFCK